MQKQLLLLATGLLLILGSGFVHAVLTDRWGPPADLSAASAKLDAIPALVGDWHSQPLEIPEAQLRGTEATGYFARAYRNQKTNAEVQVLVLCGPHGPIAVHPPTICFTSAGFQQMAAEKKCDIKAKGANGEFWNTLFTKRSTDGVPLQRDTYWAWSLAGETTAADNPRMKYASSPYLYKIYVTHDKVPTGRTPSGPSAESPCEEFLKVFLPALRTALSETT